MARDDFSKQTLDLLAKRVGIRCSNPTCRKLTTGPRSESQHIVNIGVGAHITAASPGGPRYDSNLSPEQRESLGNGIWLCQNCAKLVDNDPTRYTIETLRTWKSQAERAALAEIQGRENSEPMENSAEIELSFKKERIQSQRHDYVLEVRLTNRGTEPLCSYHIDVELPARVVHQPEKQSFFVRDRTTREVAFFRVDSELHRPKEVIYPGDAKVVVTIEYFMDNDIYWSREDLFYRPVKATLYRRGYRPLTIERPFRELQIF